jgi:hypothetical protein
MPNLYPDLDTEVVNEDSNTASMTEYISITEALKLVLHSMVKEGKCQPLYPMSLQSLRLLTQEMQPRCISLS